VNLRLIIFILPAFFFQVLHAQSVADASLCLHEKYSGKSCGEITNDDLYAVDQITDSASMTCKAPSTALKTIKDLNAVAETLFFERAAKKLLEETICEISSTELFEKEDSLIRIRSDEIANKLPFIKEQTELANRAYFEYRQTADQNNVFAANCRNTSGNVREQCFSELEKRRVKELQTETIWQQRRGLVTATMGSLWNGNTEAMNEFISKLSKYNPQPSNEVIFNALKKRIPKVKAELEENKLGLLKQSTGAFPNIKFNNLSYETKRKLVEEAVADGGILSDAVNKKDDSAIKFMCRMEGKYTKGRDSLNRTVGTAIFLIGGAAGFVSKIPVAVRAGQLTNLLSKTKSSAVVIGALATGVDATIAISAVINKCFSASVGQSIKNSCPANGKELKEAEIKNLEQNNCILEAAVSIAPAGILASSKALKTFLSKIEARKPVGREIDRVGELAPKPEAGTQKTPRQKPFKASDQNAYPENLPPTMLVKGFKGDEVVSPERFFPKVDKGGEIKVYFRDGKEILGKLVEENKEYLVVEVNGKIRKILRDGNFSNFGIATERDMAVRTVVRFDDGISQVSDNYLHNIAKAKDAAKKDFDAFAKDPTQEAYLNKLKRRHAIAAGKDTDVKYNGADDTVTTAEVAPGLFRDEAPLYRQADALGGARLSADASHLAEDFKRLEKLGIKRKEYPEIQGYDASIKEAKANGSLKRTDRLFPENPPGDEMIHNYPAGETLPVWRKLTYERYKDAHEAIQNASTPQDIASSLKKVADYYHTAINSHMFGRINASLFMNDVNIMLRRLNVSEISHGDLDLFATSTDYRDFRKVFATYVRDKIQ
jgi:hypothetical protein